MAINPRGGVKAAPKATKTVTKIDSADETGVTNVTVGRSFTIPGDGEYESQKVQVMVSAPSYEDASALVGQYMTSEFERSSTQFAQFRQASEDAAEELGEADLEDETADEGTEGAPEVADDDLTAVDVRAMKRADLEALVTDNELEVELTDFAKTKVGNAKLAEAIIEAAGLEEIDEEVNAKVKTKAQVAEEAIEEDDEALEEAAAEADEEEGTLTADDVRAMDRPALLALNKDNELGLKTKGMSDEEVAEAIIEAAGLESEEEGAEAATDEEEEAADDDEEEATSDDDETGYTRAELEKMKLKPDLQDIWKAWGIKDKFPVGAEVIAKKKAINRIMDYQDRGK